MNKNKNEKKTENVEQNEKIWDELVSCIKYSPVDYSYNVLNNPSPDALTNEELTKLANGEFINADFIDIVYSPIHQIDKITFPFPFPFPFPNQTSKKK
jgi:Ulp1 family protease